MKSLLGFVFSFALHTLPACFLATAVYLPVTTTMSAGRTASETVFEMEPNPPLWPDSVKIMHPTDGKDVMATILGKGGAASDPWDSTADSYTADHHFVRNRTAILFAPGIYDLPERFEVGYYVQIAGLGRSADDVQFVNGAPFVPALNKHLHQRTITNETTNTTATEAVGTCLDSFWRGAENFAVHQDMQWAVSQAAPLRRVHCHGNLTLHDGAAYASGGHLANAVVDGRLLAGGQQQFLVRSVELKQGAQGGAWSMVYVGCTGIVGATDATKTSENVTITVVEEPPVRMEKPFVAIHEEKFELRLPKVLRKGHPSDEYTTKPLLDGSLEGVRDFSRVRVVHADDTNESTMQSSSRIIQEALDQGKDVVLAPGIFALEATLELRHDHQVLLGLGLATLEAPRDGTPCIHVAPGVQGVRIAGLMLEATDTATTAKTKPVSLLEWGNEGKYDPGSEEYPGGLWDIFVRVGGATVGDRRNVAVQAMLRIHSGNVVGDNLWIWRADHAMLGENEAANCPHISPIFYQCEPDDNRAEKGVVVAGDDVTIYGLAVEHANGHQTMWSGERGFVAFYQCEFPYGVGQEFAEMEYRGYLIEEGVNEHTVYAPGIYSNFRNVHVMVSTAISHPEKPGVSVVNPFTVKLDNHGGISSIVNGKGPVADKKGIPIQLS